MNTFDSFQEAGITLLFNHSSNEEYLTFCPECRFHRKQENINKKPLAVNTAKGVFFCHNCGFTGNIRTPEFPKKNENKIYYKKHTTAQYLTDNQTARIKPVKPPVSLENILCGINTPPNEIPTFSTIPSEIVTQSQNPQFYPQNTFALWLSKVFGKQAAQTVLEKYKVGTSKHFTGACVFWYIDTCGNTTGNARSGKIMGYDSQTGKRIKHPHNQITWVHKVLNLPDFNFNRCLFGEHLLTEENTGGKPTRVTSVSTLPVCVVESEKTAIIAALYYPQCVWVATGGAKFKAEMFAALYGKNVVLIPDAQAVSEWNMLILKLQAYTGTEIRLDNICERGSSSAEYEAKIDLADILLTENIRNGIALHIPTEFGTYPLAWDY